MVFQQDAPFDLARRIERIGKASAIRHFARRLAPRCADRDVAPSLPKTQVARTDHPISRFSNRTIIPIHPFGTRPTPLAWSHQ